MSHGTHERDIKALEDEVAYVKENQERDSHSGVFPGDNIAEA